jgi:1-acyl-sn-glycerol-3-phosphate acyltransferase
MKWVFDKAIDAVMSVWTLATTIVYTVILGIPTIFVAMVSKTGKAPFTIGKLWAWLILKTNRVKLQVEGLEKIVRNKSYVFISNHASNLDPPALCLAIPQTLRFIAKRSLAKVPIFGQALKLGRIILIDRSDNQKAVETINKAIKDLKGGISAFFFAEGTRSPDGMLQAFKKGGIMVALKTKLPIIPITVVDSYKLLPRKALRIRPGVLRIIVGDPIDTSSYNEDDKDFLVQKVRDVIADTLKRYSIIYQSQIRKFAG